MLNATFAVAVGTRVTLRCNIYRRYSAVGTAVGYDWADGHRTAQEQPCGNSTLFENPWVGKPRCGRMNTCQHSLGLQHAGLHLEVDMAGIVLSAVITPSGLHDQLPSVGFKD